MKCNKCNIKIEGVYFNLLYSDDLYPPQFSLKNWNINFCSPECCNKWKKSECGKNYDLKRLEKLDEYLEKCKSGYKWSGGEPEDGYFLKRSSNEVYNFEEQEDIYIEEAKKIRQKWNIEEQPREREREREREQNYPTEIWNSATRTNC